MYNWLSYGVIHYGIACYAYFHDASNQGLKSSSEYVILALCVRLINWRDFMYICAEMGSQAWLHAKPVIGDVCME